MKKLLILGGNTTERVIVEHAKKLGYYTIVTDNHVDWNLSPAKQIADEAWNFSWSNIDSLAQQCIKKQVNGVIAGFSEFRVESMIKLCETLCLPCWLTMEQLDLTRDKIQFKQLCKQYQIPCVTEYDFNHVSIFPVIIKPVDRAGSVGINVAYNEQQLKHFYLEAKSLSPSKKVIIEEYIDDGTKFDVYYFIHDKNIELVGTSDTIMCDKKRGSETLQKAWTYPSVYESLFKEELSIHLEKMILDIGIIDGYVTMSAFYREGKFYFFEAGFRLSGEMSFDYYKRMTGQCYLDALIRYSLNDSHLTPRPVSLPRKNGYVITLNFFGKDGVVGSIVGLDFLKRHKNVIAFLLYVKEGDVIKNKSSVLKKIALCTLYSETKEDLGNIINLINEKFDIKSDCSVSLIYERLIVPQTNNIYAV